MHRLVACGIEIVPVADVIAVLGDHVDDPRFHGRNGHLGAVDGQCHGLVCGDGEAAGKRQCQQRHEDEQPKMRRPRLVELVQCIQIVLIPDSEPGLLLVPAIDHRR